MSIIRLGLHVLNLVRLLERQVSDEFKFIVVCSNSKLNDFCCWGGGVCCCLFVFGVLWGRVVSLWSTGWPQTGPSASTWKVLSLQVCTTHPCWDSKHSRVRCLWRVSTRWRTLFVFAQSSAVSKFWTFYCRVIKRYKMLSKSVLNYS